ncbi:hypothetical protein BSGG_5177 [Bacteroides sp. D2]|nr:hypothetical protein BSGG_5177 [Bacteroides sp. D2]
MERQSHPTLAHIKGTGLSLPFKENVMFSKYKIALVTDL